MLRKCLWWSYTTAQTIPGNNKTTQFCYVVEICTSVVFLLENATNLDSFASSGGLHNDPANSSVFLFQDNIKTKGPVKRVIMFQFMESYTLDISKSFPYVK